MTSVAHGNLFHTEKNEHRNHSVSLNLTLVFVHQHGMLCVDYGNYDNKCPVNKNTQNYTHFYKSNLLPVIHTIAARVLGKTFVDRNIRN